MSNVIRRNGQLLELLGDILDLSKIEAGRLEIQRERFRPEQLVQEVQSLMEVRASEKGLPLVIEFDGQIPETIETDPMRLRQILFNLVGNAIKFTDEGSVRLVTRFCPHPTDPLLQFDVIDTGMGITPGQQAKIFAVFTQGDTSVTRRMADQDSASPISGRLADHARWRDPCRQRAGRREHV